MHYYSLSNSVLFALFAIFVHLFSTALKQHFVRDSGTKFETKYGNQNLLSDSPNCAARNVKENSQISWPIQFALKMEQLSLRMNLLEVKSVFQFQRAQH